MIEWLLHDYNWFGIMFFWACGLAIAGPILFLGLDMRTNLRDDWRRWKKAYSFRTLTKKEDSAYPDCRRDERERAMLFVESLTTYVAFFMWPIFLIGAAGYFAYQGLKAMFMFFANIAKLADSIRGE